MPKLAIKISPFYIQALLDVVEPIEKRFRLQLAVNMDGAPDDDEILLEAWRDSLLDQLREDSSYLIELLNQLLPEHPVELSEEDAESALRAASAVRLKIREAFLSRFTEYDLERDLVEPANLGPEEQKPYICYTFLARFQEMLIVQLMPEFYDFDDMMDDEEDD
ncbi:hypothetical protein [Cerasicoccus maritimus]|uniref:hypothetical protein n=1 Tax=Cerasicoccus maritimus TaxID=490089 RepID=UPI002852AFAA|nr:hypothetical protein [Cerasicoccus maritimus]